jgi:hypothetical protein
MYLGIDFLIDKNLNLYLSEVNIGLPGGAQEYDYAFGVNYGKSSGVFKYIENLCLKKYKKSFSRYLKELTYFNDLRELKIWMDGQGRLPLNFPSILRLEDKWVQYMVLSSSYPVIETQILNNEFVLNNRLAGLFGEFAVKKRFGRGGKGFLKISGYNDIKKHNITSEGAYIIQPYIDSNINTGNEVFKFSVRALAFSGNFICMYANLSRNSTSNHGIIFYVKPGSCLGINTVNFKTVKFSQKAWEAELFYEGAIPEYLYHNLYEEEVAEAELFLPEKIFKMIKEISASVSSYYEKLDYDKLPESFIEKNFL